MALMSPLFFFSRWASLACRLLSLFLSLSVAPYSKFVDMTINLLGYRSNLRFPFSSLLTLKLSLPYKTPVAMRFPAKITSSCIWVATPVDWVILHWYACGMHERSLGRSVYGHVITKFSRMGSRAPHARLELRYNYSWLLILLNFTHCTL